MNHIILWIARDRDGSLYLYERKPILTYEESYFDEPETGYYVSTINPEFFPEITFENSPQQIELKLVDTKIDLL